MSVFFVKVMNRWKGRRREMDENEEKKNGGLYREATVKSTRH